VQVQVPSRSAPLHHRAPQHRWWHSGTDGPVEHSSDHHPKLSTWHGHIWHEPRGGYLSGLVPITPRRNHPRGPVFVDGPWWATRRFREGGAAQIPGWRTDRGRVFIRLGPPDEVLSRPQPPGSLPYEVWKYTRQRQLKYCFVDLTRFGNYVLLWTNDRLEPSEP